MVNPVALLRLDGSCVVGHGLGPSCGNFEPCDIFVIFIQLEKGSWVFAKTETMEVFWSII